MLDGFQPTDLINWMSNIMSVMAGSRIDRFFVKGLEDIIEITWSSSPNFDDIEDKNDEDH